LRAPVAIVAFAEMRIFVRSAAIVVERGTPEHARVGHHAGGNGANFVGVAVGGAAGLRSDAEVAGIDEFDVVGGFAEPFGVAALTRTLTSVAEEFGGRLDVGFRFGGGVFGRAGI
jgi:hypothetical protein